MNGIDLFSGIGGFSLGLEKAGFKTKLFCDNDEAAREVLSKHWPDTPIWKDVRTLNKRVIKGLIGDEPIDAIWGGFPCQDVSVAGGKKGFRDEEGKTTRSGLWIEFKRIIKEVNPRYVIIENVANLRSEGLAEVIKDLWQIGYVGEWHIIPARFLGALHLRERVWIIAYPDSDRLQGQRKPCGVQEEHTSTDSGTNIEGEFHATNTDHFRLWNPFTTKEAAQRWRAETSASFSNWKEAESIVCGVPNGLPDWMDEGRGELSAEESCSIIKDLRSVPEKILKKEIQRKIGGFNTLQTEKDLWAILWKLKKEQEQISSTKEGEGFQERLLRELQIYKESSDSSYRRGLEKQFGEEFKNFMRKLPHETPLERVEIFHWITSNENDRKERIKQLGNAVIPQIPEMIGRAIMEYEKSKTT